MTNISVGWDVEGVLSVEESVQSMLRVIDTLSIKDTGKFLTWEGKVRIKPWNIEVITLTLPGTSLVTWWLLTQTYGLRRLEHNLVRMCDDHEVRQLFPT